MWEQQRKSTNIPNPFSCYYVHLYKPPSIPKYTYIYKIHTHYTYAISKIKYFRSLYSISSWGVLQNSFRVIECCVARSINVGGAVTHLTIYTFVEFNENEFVAVSIFVYMYLRATHMKRGITRLQCMWEKVGNYEKSFPHLNW